jgi:hypothetical protein
LSGAVPAGMPLDPSTVHYTTLDPRHSAAYERNSNARFLTAYADLVRDADPDFTIRNQLFFDSMDQYKLSDQPLWQVQDVHVLEDKLTLTRRIGGLPDWLAVNSLFSFNLRNTVSSGRGTQSDFGNHRTDAMSPHWEETPGGLTPNTTIDASTFPWISIYRTRFSEIGAGALFDIDLFGATNLMIGGRLDRSHARNTDFAGRFNPDTGTSANPGAYAPADDSASAWDGGPSWSVSLSQQLPLGLHPYVTVAQSSVMLDGNNNSMTNDLIRAGHVGSATLAEAGLKAAPTGLPLRFSAAWFRQGRTEVDGNSEVALLQAYVSATTTKGWQAQAEWAPLRNLLVSMYGLHQGNVVYPADAFLYGGRARIVLPANVGRYARKQGNPDSQFGLSAVYRLTGSEGVTFKANYLGGTCTGRLCLVRLPSSTVLDAGAFHESRHWDMRLTVFNITDKHYFRARTGDTLGDVLAQSMPGRRWQATLRYKF